MTTPRDYIGRLDPHTGLPPAPPDFTPPPPPAWAATPGWAAPPAGPPAPQAQTVDQLWLTKIEKQLDSIRSMLVFFTYLTVIGIVVAIGTVLVNR